METASLPVVRLQRLPAAEGAGVRILLGSFAPAASTFDLLAPSLLARYRPPGGWTPGQIIVVPSMADLGISMCLAATGEGLKPVVVTPESISLERRALLRFYGAEVITLAEGTPLAGLEQRARELVQERAGSVLVSPGPAERAELSREALGRSLAQATEDEPAATLVCGAGSGGTFLGLRAALPRARAVLLACPGPHALQGWADGKALAPELRAEADEILEVSAAEAWETRRRLGREEGILLCLSAAANVAGALQVAARSEPGSFVDTVAWTSGERDFSLEEREA